mmetsp:Transcript_5376/g.15357  ORF Transcript_5376/g.15357 Transcript_5376/m.15357 type:complete len:90 (-) Transcript_5376:352-621(-)
MSRRIRSHFDTLTLTKEQTNSSRALSKFAAEKRGTISLPFMMEVHHDAHDSATEMSTSPAGGEKHQHLTFGTHFSKYSPRKKLPTAPRE